MKRAGLIAAAVFALAGGTVGARAADMATAPVDPGFTWTGPYIGAQIGYAWGGENDNLSETFDGGGGGVVPIPADDFDVDGFLGGIYGGWNWQTSSNVVIGVEGDLSFADVDGGEDYIGIYSGPGFDYVDDGNLSLNSDWQGSARLRLGYAVDRTLFYGTGGIAFAHAELRDQGITYEDIPGGDEFPYDESVDKTLVGWTIGLGVEHAFTDHWVGKLEGRYSDFGSETFEFDGYEVDADFHQAQVTVGIAYKF